MNENKPLVSAVELDALIQGWGAFPNQSIDTYFPLRSWFILLLSGAYALRLLFFPEVVAANFSSEAIEIARLSKFLYFRGWFLISVIGLAAYAYFKDWYMGILFFCILLVGCVNFIFDLFNIYAEQLSKPTPLLTLVLLVRLFILWLLYINLKNTSRMPQGWDKINVLLPFKRLA
ncbi:MAG: hypothetical protein AAB176_02000 [Pseudomonadota bacterium]|jgi:hypothetical protein